MLDTLFLASIHKIFVTNSSSISAFQDIFDSADKTVILEGGLSTRQHNMKFWDFSDIF